MKLLSGMIDDGAAAVLGGVHAVDVRCWCVVGPAPAMPKKVEEIRTGEVS